MAEKYITKSDVINHLQKIQNDKLVDSDYKKFAWGIEIFIDSLPVADVVPVVHAMWEMRNFNKKVDRFGCVHRIIEPTFTCTNCRKVYSHVSPYCPNCGAKMDGAQNIETCICCGETIPEGRQVCPKCEKGE